MKNYTNYKLEDFLLDEDFLAWVVNPSQEDDAHWNNVMQQTGQGPLMRRAHEIIRVLVKDNEGLAAHELEFELSRIAQSTRQPEKRLWLWPFKIAAAAAVFITFGLGWHFYSNSIESESFRTYQQYVASAGDLAQEISNKTASPKHVILPDGSKVRLMPASSISYHKPFIKDRKREVYMRGEVFFEVQKDAGNPFLVYANGLLTKVVGTSFLVKTIDQEVHVSVSSGRVTVLPIKDQDSQKIKNTELLLNPNQQALFSTKDNLISKSIVEMPIEIQKAPIPHLAGEEYPVTEIFPLLEQTYGIPILFDKEVLSQCYLRADFTVETFFTKLDVICMTIGASYEVKDGQIIIASAGCKN
jgi:transmembrane sensor